MGKHETLFERLARERNITVEEMRAIISVRVEAGMKDPDPVKRASWERIASLCLLYGIGRLFLLPSHIPMSEKTAFCPRFHGG